MSVMSRPYLKCFIKINIISDLYATSVVCIYVIKRKFKRPWKGFKTHVYNILNGCWLIYQQRIQMIGRQINGCNHEIKHNI